MKKNIFFTAFLLLSIVFSGCYNTVFYDIRQDVSPETATVSGNITSITRYTAGGKEYLALAADGGLRYKAAEDSGHGNWQTVSYENLPFSPHYYEYFDETHEGEQIIKVLADSTTLYIVTTSYKNDSYLGTTVSDKIKVYGAVISDWDAITTDSWTTIIDDDNSSTYFPIYNYSYYYYSAFSIFQTNAPQTEHRKVYIRTGDTSALVSDYQSVTCYELSGTGAPAEISVTPQEALIDSSVTGCVNSAVWFKGEPVFFNTKVSTTNETAEDEASYFYYTSGSTVYHSSSAGSAASETLSAGNVVSALATCEDALLIGGGNFSSSTSSSGGMKKATLTEGIPGTELIDFSTNASFQVSSSYYVTALLNATPEKAEEESDWYVAITYIGTGTSTSVSSKNIGLWSYYPERGNWNRE